MSGDIFVAQSSPEDALVQQLHTITFVTAEKEQLHRTLTEGFSLEHSGWKSSGDFPESVGQYFGFGDGDRWETNCYFRSDEGKNVQIRVLAVDESKPQIRPTVSGRYLGGASIGFPMTKMAEREAMLAKVGVESSVGIKEMEFTGPQGEVYVSAEIHFMAAENVFLLGVLRPDIFVPVGKLNAAQGIGAAAYSARCVTNTDSLLDFYRDTLGFETRRDVVMEVGVKSGLKLELGSPERFVQAFAPGSQTGYLVFLDHLDATLPSPAPNLNPPNRGMTMWTFTTRKMAALVAKLEAANIEIVSKPSKSNSPFLPDANTLLFKDPEGFMIEVIEVL